MIPKALDWKKIARHIVFLANTNFTQSTSELKTLKNTKHLMILEKLLIPNKSKINSGRTCPFPQYTRGFSSR